MWHALHIGKPKQDLIDWAAELTVQYRLHLCMHVHWKLQKDTDAEFWNFFWSERKVMDDLPKLFSDKRHEGVKQSQHGFKHIRENCLSPRQGYCILVLVESSLTGLNVPEHKRRLLQPLAIRKEMESEDNKTSPI